LEIFSELDADIHQAKIRPTETMIIGLNFSDKGKINIEVLIGGIHDIALPAIIDSEESATIGLIILICSSILTNRGPE